MEKVIPPRGPLSSERMHSCFCEGLSQIKVSAKWQRFPVKGQRHVKELYQTLALHPGIQIVHNAETTTNNEVPPFFCAVSCFLSLSLLLLSEPVYFSSSLPLHLPVPAPSTSLASICLLFFILLKIHYHLYIMSTKLWQLVTDLI